VRITPSIRSQKGRIWSKNTMPNKDWEVEVLIRINGRGRIGADGMVNLFNKKKK
jgi:lectin, mannose-binding 1